LISILAVVGAFEYAGVDNNAQTSLEHTVKFEVR